MTQDRKTFGQFDDEAREFVIRDPLTPSPWINYLGNTRLTAFISQQAGGMVWHVEPQQRRITRYHHLPAPGDRPGFYVYVQDRETGAIWNPHFAPTCERLDAFECRHGLGYSTIAGERGGVRVSIRYFIPPGRDVFVWDLEVANRSARSQALTLASYVEFGVLEFMRELFWCYLKNQIGFDFDPDLNGIRYHYRVFEAPYAPAMFFSCTRKVDGFDCSREAFCGPGRSLERPLLALSGSRLPSGGQGCGALGARLDLAPGQTERFAFLLGVAEDWPAARRLRDGFEVGAALADLAAYWNRKTGTLRVETGDAHVDRAINTWTPLNCQITLERTRDVSTDHMGVDGMRFRDTMQDALAVSSFDPAFAAERIRLVLASQARDGSGPFAFYPYGKPLRYQLEPVRSDNTVWPVYTIVNLVGETGDLSFWDESVGFRDGGAATVYEHVRLGLDFIWRRRGAHGLPLLFHADWNDGLAVFHDERAGSVMLGMQLVYAARLFAETAAGLGRGSDADWCRGMIAELTAALNSDAVWDGEWYRRLVLSNGSHVGGRAQPQGAIYLEPQAWAVISGVGDAGQRGRRAMDAAWARLDTTRGLCICAPPFTGIPTPNDPMIGNAPGIGENGGIFCHANTWAVIAECLLGRGDRAWSLYRKLLPSVAAEEVGQAHWGREPYVFNSTVVGPAQGRDFGRGGISWLTGTASWMYMAATQYMLGLRPAPDGLYVRPCLPAGLGPVHARRRFRGREYDIELNGADRAVRVNGKALSGDRISP